MTSEAGYFYNGRDSHRHDVRIAFDGEKVVVTGNDIDLTFLPSEVRLSPALGTTRRSLYLPNGAKCELDDGPLAATLAKRSNSSFHGTLHRWEKSVKRALVALLLTLVVLWGFLRYGVPILAREVAYAIPVETEEMLGRESLDVLDRIILKPTKLPEDRRIELQRLFEEVVSAFEGGNYRLELRAAPGLGPNALALPSGIIVLTDELVTLSLDDEELTAVLAHEAGHIDKRHAIRQTLQNSGVALIIASLTGDVFSATSVAASLPTVLAEARFSRDLEREADDVAIAYLKERNISIYRFSDILIRTEESLKRDDYTSSSLWERLFSTHPTTEDRLRHIKE